MDGTARRVGTRDLELRLLGPLEASRRGCPIALGGPKPRALLAILALDLGRAVSIDRLVEELWPADPPDTATHAVQVYVSQLRKKLGADALPRRGPGYALALDPDRIDVTRFARLVEEGREALATASPDDAARLLREALGLWRGPALTDFVYEPFAQAEISRLEELRAVAIEERIEADLALGRHVELVSELEALAEASPLRERPRAQLMLALYRSERQSDALAAYRSAREMLVEELGVEPGPELKALEAAILRQDESLLLAEDAEPRPAMQYRRIVTILHAELGDSIAFAETLDPETRGTILQQYVATVSAVVHRHGGSVENVVGSEVLAGFGAPVAHEDDALRAARAALEIQAGLAALGERLAAERRITLEAKVGLAASEVVTVTSDGRRRLVAGDAIGIAERIARTAEPGEVRVGEVVARLVDHAARLEPCGALRIDGRQEPFAMFRLLDTAPVAPAFARRLDAPFAGRRKELALLRKALRSAKAEERVRAVTVIGAPGIGKSRLAADFAARAKNVRALFGRCLSYGDGITYWPLREILGQAPAGDERDAVLELLDSEPPPPTLEIALVFRRFCERLARERTLVLVFDDVHWAEPTFLDLLDLVADKGDGPILVLCLAREELLEQRPGFLAEGENASRIELDALSAAETEALLEGLGAGGVLESDQHSRITEAAEGNPLFVEQLLALALEGGLAEGQMPETIQSLLVARLDRLGPGERAVLERGAVIGKEFRLDDVAALVEPAAATTVEPNAQTLIGRGFIRPLRAGDFGFRHVLVQEAVYRASPKRLRAELHEKYADRLEERQIVDLDEFAGYHLERAYRLRTELGENNRRTATLAEHAGERLGQAGNRAWRRNDEFTTVRLLGRAVSLLPPTDSSRLDMLCELAIAFVQLGELETATRMAAEAASGAAATHDRSRELRARLELAVVELTKDPASAGALLEIANAAIPTFESVDDHRSLGRAWLLVGWAQGAIRCRYGVRLQSAERAIVHYRAAGLATSSCLGEIAASLYYGPTPVTEALALCDDLLEDERGGQLGRANVLVYKGGLEAQRGEFARARELVESGRGVFEEYGQLVAAVARGGAVLGDVELLAGNAMRAEAVLRTTYAALEPIGDASSLASRAADLAEALVEQDQLDDADEWIAVWSSRGSSADIAPRIRNLAVRARLAAHRGDTETGESLALEAVSVANETDALNFQGRSLMALAEVLLIGRRREDASEVVGEAVRAFEEKGNIAAAARARELMSSPVTA